MKFYKDLKRTVRMGELSYIPRFKEAFPELKNIDTRDLASRFELLGMDFYTEIKKPVPNWIRITLPIAMFVIAIMYICLPFLFMLTGRWNYNYSKSNILINWFRKLGL